MNDYAIVGFGIAGDALESNFRYGGAGLVGGIDSTARLGSARHWRDGDSVAGLPW